MAWLQPHLFEQVGVEGWAKSRATCLAWRRRRTCAARRSGEAGNGGVCGGPPDRQQCPATSRHGHGRRATLRALSSACSRLQVPRRAAVVASRHRPEISTAPGADKLVRLHTLGEGSEGAPRTPRACQRGEQWRCDHRGVANSRRVGKSSCEREFPSYHPPPWKRRTTEHVKGDYRNRNTFKGITCV